MEEERIKPRKEARDEARRDKERAGKKLMGASDCIILHGKVFLEEMYNMYCIAYKCIQTFAMF